MTEKDKNRALIELKNSLTPQEIVAELDRYIVGQNEAKAAAAISLRNRYRRKAVPVELQDEIMPKNILMIGPTGVGKTEIARRLSKIASAPFIKIEATKFTEVGYVGRDVESIIRDLVEISINIVKTRSRKSQHKKARKAAEERVLDALVGENSSDATRNKFREMLRKGEMDDKEIEINVQESPKSSVPTFDMPGMPGSQMGVINIGDMIGKALGSDKKVVKKKMKVRDSYKILIEEESNKLLDEDKIIEESIDLTENDGIVFIDEIDKITSGSGNSKGGDISREGVQRDLLPLIEGTTVSTKYGHIKTDHILFISSGAFYTSKPSDLLPELQGRLPIRVELHDLTKEDMIKILEEPDASLVKQYKALMETEEIELEFKKDGIEQLASIATLVNKNVENIGARRLHTIMEKLLEEISFRATEYKGKKVLIDAKFVKDKLGNIAEKKDLSNFIL
ncbi:MAG: ATP-dependent protease ATPase subunit HslU [Alphaproteobacteria bacterium]|nr:ATP-dependent protease ATPase subunit HslU [Alphaproteobacteria bacterium]